MTKVSYRLDQAYRPRTIRAYSTQFKLFLAFAALMKVSQLHDLDLLLAFIECLSFNKLSVSTIKNYVSAVKQQFQKFNLPLEQFQNHKIYLMYRSLQINRPLKVTVRGIITISILKQIIQQCQSLQFPALYKALFLTAFYSFLRISNFAAEAAGQFDRSRNLIRNDVIFAAPGAHIIIRWTKIRWTKTLQGRDRVQVIQIPEINSDKQICPVAALQDMFMLYPHNKTSPLFCLPHGQALSQGRIRDTLAHITSSLGFPPGFITFHAFRRSGATLAFNNGVTLQNIQVHGGWRSNAIWLYLNQTHKAAGIVARTFQTIL